MFYHVRHFTLLCLPKGCLLLSNRLSLKKSLEEATEELRRLWKGQLWRERALWTTLSRHAVLVQSKAQSTAADLKADASAAGPLLKVWVSGGLGVEEFGTILDVKLVAGGVCGGKIELWRACWGGFWWSGGPKCQIYGILGAQMAKVSKTLGF